MSAVSIRSRLVLGMFFVASLVEQSWAQASSIRATELQQTDPDGFILTLTAVSVVFSALMLLVLAFRLIGLLFQKYSTQQTSGAIVPIASQSKNGGNESPTPEALIAISLALHQEYAQPNPEEMVAISLALHTYMQSQWHDTESYRLTIQPRKSSQWQTRSLGMRQYTPPHRY